MGRGFTVFFKVVGVVKLEGSEGVVNRVQEKEKEKPKRKFGDLSWRYDR